MFPRSDIRRNIVHYQIANFSMSYIFCRIFRYSLFHFAARKAENYFPSSASCTAGKTGAGLILKLHSVDSGFEF